MQTPRSSETHRVFVSLLAWLEPNGLEKLATFRASAGDLFRRHDLRVERTLQGTGKGQLVSANPWDVPDVIQVFSLPSSEAFMAYTGDAEYKALAAARDVGIRRMVAVLGTPRDVAALSPESDSKLETRLYGVAFTNFEPGGAEALLEFNRKGTALFHRHGMHVEAMIDVAKTVTPRGPALEGFAPERVIVFYLDDPNVLKAYVSDPEYKQLAPIRDRGLRRYDFFLARVPHS